MFALAPPFKLSCYGLRKGALNLPVFRKTRHIGLVASASCHTNNTSSSTAEKAAPTNSISTNALLFKTNFKVVDKAITLQLEASKDAFQLKLVEAEKAKLTRTVMVPMSGVAPLASALMEFSSLNIDDQLGLQNAPSFVPKRFTLSMQNKHIFLDMRKSNKGYYLNVNEEGMDGKSLVIPAEGIEAFQSAMKSVLSVCNALDSILALNKEADGQRFVFMSGFASTITRETLMAHCTTVGGVETVSFLTETRPDGTVASLGCGLVEFASSETAQRAVEALAQSTLEGCTLSCYKIGSMEASNADEATPCLRIPHPRKVFVGGLPKEITTEELTSLFSEAGTVLSVEVLVNNKGRVLGFAEVEFSDAAGAQAALAQLNGREMEGRWIYVRELFVDAGKQIEV